MRKLIGWVIVMLTIFTLGIASCDDKKVTHVDDTPESGTINISVDESFKPVIDEQIKMYEDSYPNAKIIAHYKPEADCLRDLFKDTSNRLVIITRRLNPNEDKYLIDSLDYIAGSSAIASDAIAVLVNAASNDTLFSLKRLQDQLQGRINRQQTIVFDGLKATSAVRFITDSVLKGGNFDTSVVKAAANSNEVINYVASHENAIGLVGINWIGNPEVPSQVEMLKKLKIAYVQCDACEGKPYVKPMQQSILTHRYPLVRGLYYVIKENYKGLGSGFTAFLRYERGQLIFRRAYLGPVMDFGVRNVKVNEKIPAD
jgi:phosphate transport system substrate-binding protein